MRSLQETPILADGPPPKYIGSKPESFSASWTAQANLYSRNYMTALCPWDLDSLMPPYGIDWSAFATYMSHLHGDGGQREPTFLEISRAKLINSVSRNLSINKKNKNLAVLWRGHNSTSWNGKTDWSSDFQNINSATSQSPVLDPKTLEKRARAIDALRKATIVDEARQDRREKAMTEYISTTLASLDTIFDIHQVPQRTEESPDFPISHVRSNSPGEPTTDDIRDGLKRNEIFERPSEDQTLADYPGNQRATGHVSQEIHHKNYTQQQAQFLRRLELYLQSLASGLQPRQELLLLYGGPGVGKTPTIIGLQELAAQYNDGVVVCAPTGSAASNIPHAYTIHSLFGFRVVPQDMITDKMLPPMSQMKLAAVKHLFVNKHIFLIDEISIVGLIGLGLIDQRLKEITGYTDRSFGGLAVVLSGDPFQLQPVNSKSLFTAAVDNKKKHPAITPSRIGTGPFTRFTLNELSDQMRTDDPKHITIINTLRNPQLRNPIDDNIIHYFTSKQLTAEDVERDSTWLRPL